MMARSRLRLLIAAVLLGMLYRVGARGAGSIPPLGAFLEPANGAWALARSALPPATESAQIAGLSAPVTVLTDDRGVPHVFAKTEEDAWRAQGYLVARDRLFQMELQTRATAGRLAELLGRRVLEADRTARRRGLAWAARRNFEAADSGAPVARAARAYAEGVNAWIDGMPRAALPLEYRLLGARPMRWEPIYTSYLFSQMSLTLAWEDATLEKLRARALVGSAAAEALFPLNAPIQEPIQPNGAGAPRYDFVRPMPPPGAPDTAAAIAAREREGADLALGLQPRPRSEGDAIGSNNWAVAPKRTAAGHALLSGDPHLELTLPSIWYEIHLQVQDSLDVAGVTFAGVPGVIIGFNRDVAWSFTNTGADVRDHYVETVDNDAHPTKYRLDGAWKPVSERIEEFRGPGGVPFATDTFYATHRGPLVKNEGRWISTRWTPLETAPGAEFIRLDRARSVTEWLDDWKQYAAPAQNGIVADRAGAIAIRSTGTYPVRPGDGRGDELRDGSNSTSDWIGTVPLEEYPFSLNPAQGFLASANQQPVDPRSNHRYFGVDWYSPWRAMRINQLLRADSSVTPDAMRGFQTDARSARAEAFLPWFRRVAAAPPSDFRGDTVFARAAKLLMEWKGEYTPDDNRAILFEMVMEQFALRLFDELLPPGAKGDTAQLVVQPQDMIALELLNDSASAWWDDRRTRARESREEILAESIRLGYLTAVNDFGAPGDSGWVWGNAHHANIYHLLRLPALSALELPVRGGTSTLSPSPGRGTHGPSWRMVVELGPDVRAWATYPGGQSGNPASPWYLDRLPAWLHGQLDTLLFPASTTAMPTGRVRATLTLTGGR